MIDKTCGAIIAALIPCTNLETTSRTAPDESPHANELSIKKKHSGDKYFFAPVHIPQSSAGDQKRSKTNQVRGNHHLHFSVGSVKVPLNGGNGNIKDKDIHYRKQLAGQHHEQFQ